MAIPETPKQTHHTRQSLRAKYHDQKIIWDKRFCRYSPVRWMKHAPAGLLLVLVFLVSITCGMMWLLTGPLLIEFTSLDDDQWSGFEAITTAAAFVFGVGAGLILLVELVQNTDGRNLDIYRDIYEKFMSDRLIEARRYIYSELPDTQNGQELLHYVNAHSEAKRAVKDVMNAIDYFGFLADQDWVTAKSMIGWVSPIVVKVWIRIGPLVEYECQERAASEPDYYESARRLVERCHEWRDQNLPRGLTPARLDKKRL